MLMLTVITMIMSEVKCNKHLLFFAQLGNVASLLQRERQRQTDRQTETERQRQRDRERERERQTDKQTDRQIDRVD